MLRRSVSKDFSTRDWGVRRTSDFRGVRLTSGCQTLNVQPLFPACWDDVSFSYLPYPHEHRLANSPISFPLHFKRINNASKRHKPIPNLRPYDSNLLRRRCTSARFCLPPSVNPSSRTRKLSDACCLVGWRLTILRSEPEIGRRCNPSRYTGMMSK